jgi:hypothetical protein
MPRLTETLRTDADALLQNSAVKKAVLQTAGSIASVVQASDVRDQRHLQLGHTALRIDGLATFLDEQGIEVPDGVSANKGHSYHRALATWMVAEALDDPANKGYFERFQIDPQNAKDFMDDRVDFEVGLLSSSTLQIDSNDSLAG